MSFGNFTVDIADLGGRQKKNGEKREAPRAPLHFKVAIVYHQHEDEATRPRYHGRTNDISLKGLSILVGHNIFNEGEVTVLLAIPPAHIGETQKVIEATAKMVYTVFSSEHDTFRIGLEFRKFKRNGDQLLKKVIDERYIKPNYPGAAESKHASAQ